MFIKVLDTDMFSIDSTYDLKFEDFAIDERMDLYRCLKKEGVGITVMKAFVEENFEKKMSHHFIKP